MTEPRERPILFSGPMVRAILDGTKTQTRRTVKPQPAMLCRYEMNAAGTHALHLSGHGPGMLFVPPTAHSKDHLLPCPYGAPGERLWVRETFAIETSAGLGDYPPPHSDGRPIRRFDDTGEHEDHWEQPHYRATDREPCLSYDDRDEPGVRWKPSIFMPRWASRITLEVTEVRVQRLQDISYEDAIAEGIERSNDERWPWRSYDTGDSTPFVHPTTSFQTLWESINGAKSWNANPWVWVVSFKRVAPEGGQR